MQIIQIKVHQSLEFIQVRSHSMSASPDPRSGWSPQLCNQLWSASRSRLQGQGYKVKVTRSKPRSRSRSRLESDFVGCVAYPTPSPGRIPTRTRTRFWIRTQTVMHGIVQSLNPYSSTVHLSSFFAFYTQALIIANGIASWDRPGLMCHWPLPRAGPKILTPWRCPCRTLLRVCSHSKYLEFIQVRSHSMSASPDPSSGWSPQLKCRLVFWKINTEANRPASYSMWCDDDKYITRRL